MLVIKIGGSIADACDELLDEIAGREDVVLVHGFGPQTDRALAERSIEARTLVSPTGVTSRYTDEAVLEAMQVAALRVQSSLVEGLEERGADPAGLGLDVPLVWGEAKAALRHQRSDGRVVLVRGNRSGRVVDVQPGPVEAALDAGRLPVVTPLALDEEGPLSVDADRAAAALAGALEADELVLLTDVPGVLEDPSDPSSRIDRLATDRIDEMVGDEVDGGMVRKLVAAREATDAGVPAVHVADGTREEPIEQARSGASTEVIG